MARKMTSLKVRLCLPFIYTFGNEIEQYFNSHHTYKVKINEMSFVCNKLQLQFSFFPITYAVMTKIKFSDPNE